MANDRSYTEEEFHKIIDLALAGDERDESIETHRDGLTLQEIQEIGGEIGIVPERIAEAARSLGRRSGLVVSGRSLGMPVEVGCVIEVRRDVTADEWDLIVAELRNAVGERGQVMAHGSGREWVTGTFQARLEPTGTGARIRLRTFKEGARIQNALGVAALALGLMLLGWILSGVSPPAVEVAMLMSVAVGGGLLGLNFLSLPRWTRRGERQLGYIADCVSTLLEEPAGEPPTKA